MSSRTSARRSRLELDRLEERATPTASVVSGNLVIVGTTGNDVVVVTKVQVNGAETIRVREGTKVTNFAASSITGNVQFTGDAGNDFFTNLTKLNTVADGGLGNDRLVGGGGSDVLNGGEGNDILAGGIDTVGNTLTGGLGIDTLFGSNGPDVLVVGTGGATEGDSGRNFAYGAGGDDTITGAAGADILSGDTGNDTINAGAGNDSLFGGSGLDTLNGEDGDDFLDGGLDRVADVLTGGAGKDRFREPFFVGLFGIAKDTLTDFTEGTDTKGGLIRFF